jgi:hypothetical protein
MLAKARPDDLHSRRQVVIVEAGGDGGRGKAEKVDRHDHQYRLEHFAGESGSRMSSPGANGGFKPNGARISGACSWNSNHCRACTWRACQRDA